MSGAKRHLTDTLARKAKPKSREYALADVALQGFALRVQPSGSKAWILRMRVEGKLRRFTIGSPNTMNADEARTRALQLRIEHQTKTVIQLATADEPTITFYELSDCLLQAKAGVWKPSTIKAVTTYLKAELLPAFGDRPINRLTTAEIANWFHVAVHRP